MNSLFRRVTAILTAIVMLVMMMPVTISEAAISAVERIDLNIDAITIGVGQKVKTVKPEVYPEGASATFTWASADEKIAKVNSKGKITGVKKGSTTITITADNGVTAEVEVNVVKKGKGVTGITLNKKSATITRGKTLTLKATLTPKKPKNKTIIWTSSNENIATVDSTGKVTAVANGSATISAISSSGKTAKCKVTVEGIKVKKIKVAGKASMLRNETQQLNVEIKPAGADNKELKWKTSDKKIATVDQNGVVTAIKKGSVTITATAKDGSKVKGTFKMTVKPDGTPTPDFPFDYSKSESGITITEYTGKDKNVTIPSEHNGLPVIAIGNSAFSGCSKLTSITIPDSISSIGNDAFKGCYDIESVYAESLDGWMKIKFSNTYSNPMVLGDRTNLYIGGTLLTNLTIPEGVHTIGDNVFAGCDSIISISIPEGVTSIGASAFYKCSGTSITIPDSITSIGEDAFYNCYSLNNIYAESLDGWMRIAFANRDANPAGFTTQLYFAGEVLTDLVIPEDISVIKDYTFAFCSSLSSVKLSDSVTSIGEEAFYYCDNLRSITLNNNITSIGDGTFFGCDVLKKVYAENINSYIRIAFAGYYSNPTSYGNADLYISGKLLTDLIIPDGTTKIGDYAFYGCQSITSILIPDSVTDIGTQAFEGCSNLKKVYAESLDGWMRIKFTDEWANPLDNACELYVGGKLLTNLVIPEQFNRINDNTFHGCISIISVTIPDSVTSIGWDAFSACSSLTKVIIPNSVTSIKGYAFRYCSSLDNVTIPDSLSKIEYGVFAFCESLTSITIPNTVTCIESSAFYGCSNLARVTIGNGVTDIEDEAFSNCSRLTTVTIPNSVTSIGFETFGWCSNLKKIIIPASVTSIGHDAFCMCGKLTATVVKNSYAHKYCEKNDIPVKFSK